MARAGGPIVIVHAVDDQGGEFSIGGGTRASREQGGGEMKFHQVVIRTYDHSLETAVLR